MTTEYEKRVNGRLTVTFHATPEAGDEIDTLLRRLCPASEAHGNCRAVLIWGEIDSEVYQKQIAERGAKPITENCFPSAKAASRHFGYHWDAVGQALGRAAERGEQVARVAGVPVVWADEVVNE